MENVDPQTTVSDGTQSVGDVVGNDAGNSRNDAAWDKILRQRKADKEKMEAMQAELNERKQKELEATGQQSKLIESLREQVSELSGKLKSSTASFAWNTVESQVKTMAAKEGCKHPDKLVKLMEEKMAEIEVYDDYSINQDDAIRLINAAKEENDFLFAKSQVKVADAVPNNNPDTKVKKKTAMDMSREELMEAANRLTKNSRR